MPESDAEPLIEFVGAAPSSVEALDEDLLDVGREPRSQHWLLNPPRWALATAASAVVLAAGAIALLNGPSHSSTSAAGPHPATPASVSASTGPGGSRINWLPIGSSAPIGNWHREIPVQVPRGSTRIEVLGTGASSFYLSMNSIAPGVTAALTHYLPAANIISGTTTSRIQAPGGPGALTTRTVIARLEGHRITITVRSTDGRRRPGPLPRHRPPGVRYRLRVVVPGYLVDITVTGPAGWRPPALTLSRLAEDPRLVNNA